MAFKVLIKIEIIVIIGNFTHPFIAGEHQRPVGQTPELRRLLALRQRRWRFRHPRTRSRHAGTNPGTGASGGTDGGRSTGTGGSTGAEESQETVAVGQRCRSEVKRYFAENVSLTLFNLIFFPTAR